MALALPGLCADGLGEKGLGRGVAMQQAVLTTFFVVDHELNGDLGALRPFWIKRASTITMQVTGGIGE